MMLLLPQWKRRKTHRKRRARGRWTLVVTSSTILIFAATALQAQPSPSSMPTPHLSKELQEVFDREEKLTPIMHQHALAIFDQIAADLHRLRDRLEP